jgi:hypothetical protein
MTQTRRTRCFTQSLFVLGGCLGLLLLMGRMALADPTATITAPTPKSVLSGTVRVLGVATDADGIRYAILSVDSAGISVTNTLPLRFELDTRNFPDGAHLLKVEIFDNGGSLTTSPAVKVYFKNAAPPAGKPAPITAPAHASGPVAAKPAGKPAMTAGKPGAAPAAPARVPATTAAGKQVPATQTPAPAVAQGTKSSPAANRETAAGATPRTGTTVAATPSTAAAAKPAPAAAPARTPAGDAAILTAKTTGTTLTITLPAPQPRTGNRDGKASPSTAGEEPRLIAVPLTAPASAARPVTVLLDGKAVSFTPEPYIANGRTMLVLRSLIQQAGSEKLRWDNAAKQATASIGNTHYLFTPNQRIVLRDGEAITLVQPLSLVAGRLFIPATAWRDLFDGAVSYDASSRQVVLGTTARAQARLAK